MNKLFKIIAFLLLSVQSFGQSKTGINCDYYYITGSLNVGAQANGIYADPSLWLNLGRDTTTKGIGFPKVILSAFSTTKKGVYVYSINDSNLYQIDGSLKIRYLNIKDTVLIKNLIAIYGGGYPDSLNLYFTHTQANDSLAKYLKKSDTARHVKVATYYYVDSLYNTISVIKVDSSLWADSAGYAINSGLLGGHPASYFQTALGYTPVPSTRSIQINGVLHDLSADRTWLISRVDSSSHSDTSGYSLNAGLLQGNNGSYYLNRANHTGTQAWSTITSTPTTIGGYGITDYNSLWDARLATKTTSDLTEGGNKYYTDARSRAAISLTTTGSGAATYNNTTGVLNVPTPSINPGTVTSVSVVSVNGFSGSVATATTTPAITITTSVSGILKGNSTAISSATAGTDYTTPSSTETVTNKSISGSANTLTNIPNNALTNSTISGVSLGSNLFALTLGYGLNGTSYNGSAAVTATADTSIGKLATQQYVGNSIAGYTPTTRTISTTTPLSGGGDLSANRTLSINNAAADATTKGASTYTAADFNDNGSGVISIDYTNGQASSTSTKGFLNSTDWNAFNGKQAAISLTNTGTTGASTFLSNVLNIPIYQGQITLTTTGTTGTASLIGNTLNIPNYATGGGSGNVSGPASSTDKAITRWNGTAGTTVQNSKVVVTDTGGVVFPQIYGLPYTKGQLYFDSTCDCLEMMGNTSATTLNIGQELWENVYNATGSTINSGQAVYITGGVTINGEVYATVALAQANSGTTTVSIGIATENIANNTRGKITTSGTVHGLNTSALSIGNVFLSATTPGALTNTAPTSPNYRYRVGVVSSIDATNGTIKVTGSTAALGNGTANQVLGINNAGTAQEFKTIGYDSSGSNMGITNTAGAITLNWPTASSTVRGILTPVDWNNFNGKQGVITLTTTGSSGAATLVGTTLNIPQYSGGGGTPGGSSRQVQYNNASAFAGAASLTIQNEGYPHIAKLAGGSSTTAPTSGGDFIYLDSIGFAMRDKYGYANPIQADWGFINYQQLVSTESGFNQTMGTLGNVNVTGTATQGALAKTSAITLYTRTVYTSAATAGSKCELYASTPQFSLGGTAYGGGFRYVGTFGAETFGTGSRLFAGFESTGGGIGNVDPSSLANIIGLSKDVTETSNFMQFVHNDASGTATKVSTGVALDNTAIYELVILVPPNSNVVDEVLYKKTLSGGHTYVNGIEFSTDVPATTVFLNPHIWINNGTTASAIKLDFYKWSIEYQ